MANRSGGGYGNKSYSRWGGGNGGRGGGGRGGGSSRGGGFRGRENNGPRPNTRFSGGAGASGGGNRQSNGYGNRGCKLIFNNLFKNLMLFLLQLINVMMTGNPNLHVQYLFFRCIPHASQMKLLAKEIFGLQKNARPKIGSDPRLL